MKFTMEQMESADIVKSFQNTLWLYTKGTVVLWPEQNIHFTTFLFGPSQY